MWMRGFTSAELKSALKQAFTFSNVHVWSVGSQKAYGIIVSKYKTLPLHRRWAYIEALKSSFKVECCVYGDNKNDVIKLDVLRFKSLSDAIQYAYKWTTNHPNYRIEYQEEGYHAIINEAGKIVQEFDDINEAYEYAAEQGWCI